MKIKKSSLALYGGSKTISYKLSEFNFIDKKEINSVNKVLKSGKLSGFYANKKNFSGGKYVQLFEKNIKNYFNTKYAITFNSWTSGLIACVGAINTEPGDEIILPSWTMSACAMAILHWGAIPVFADIDEETFNIDPKKIESKITRKTKAIMIVDIFGHPADFDPIKKIAKKYNLKIIEDAAQSIGSKYKKKYTGTYSDLGGFSFNAHKHIQTGEGGVVVTNNNFYAKKLRLIRNHGEVLVNDIKKNLPNMIGYNFRPTEIDAAIGIEQLKKLKKIVFSRQKIAQKLINGLSKLPFILTPKIKNKCTHSFYVFGLKINTNLIKISIKKIYQALVAEGVPALSIGYMDIQKLPIFKNKIAYGSKKFPWSINPDFNKYNYNKNLLPITERMNNQDLIKIGLCRHKFNNNDVKLIIKAFNKVWKNLVIPNIKYKNVKLRILKKKNISYNWIRWLNDKKVNKYSRLRKKIHTKKTQLLFLNKILKSKNTKLYGIFFNGKHVGNIEIDIINKKKGYAEIKFLLGEKRLWNKGLMTIAVNKATEIAFNKLKLNCIYGGSNKNNLGSIRIFEKNSFKKIHFKRNNIYFRLKNSDFVKLSS